jgi:hypothetical protein
MFELDDLDRGPSLGGSDQRTNSASGRLSRWMLWNDLEATAFLDKGVQANSSSGWAADASPGVVSERCGLRSRPWSMQPRCRICGRSWQRRRPQVSVPSPGSGQRCQAARGDMYVYCSGDLRLRVKPAYLRACSRPLVPAGASVSKAYRVSEATPVIHAAALKAWGNLKWAWPKDGGVRLWKTPAYRSPGSLTKGPQ